MVDNLTKLTIQIGFMKNLTKISRDHTNRGAHNWLIYKLMDRFIRKHSGQCRGQIFDLGCGDAPYKDFLLQNAESYVGVDWSGSQHENNEDVTADLNHPLPINNEVADTVVSFSVIEHLSEPQVMLHECYRIMRPGAVLLLQVPWQWQLHESPHDYYRYTEYGLRHMLTKAGFIDVVVEPQSGVFTTIVMKINYFSRRFVRGSRVIKLALNLILIPVWYFGQIVAPLLDRLDKNWSAETTGFFVVARK